MNIKLSYIIFPMLALNIAWVVIGAIRDYLKTDNTNIFNRIDRNQNIAMRNVKSACINVVLAIIIIVGGLIFHLSRIPNNPRVYIPPLKLAFQSPVV